ncbi:hypothetical protein L6452_14705 [Arctium lappa]|uniref:Uncharacterized protein n=1 Tax=Arctium lappa TaxID=4217 RepID=A0ACB9CLY4_ARCLA|nr:hypothetical protein L6452_14705 [Arctium lappa]
MAQSTLIVSKNVKFAVADFEIRKNNHLERLNFDAEKFPHLVEAANFLKQSCLSYALQVDPKPSKALLQQFWFTVDKGSVVNKKGESIPAISFTTQHGPGNITALAVRTALRFPSKIPKGFDPLTSDVELIQFLDHMEYQWDNKPRTTIPNKKLTKILKANMPSEMNYIFTLIIQSVSGKIGSLDQATKIQLQMGYSLLVGKHFDYAGAIFDDLLSKIEKPERDAKIPYVRFISAILHFFLGQKYPTEGDCNFSKVGPCVLVVKPFENEVSLQNLRLRISSTSTTSVVTPMVHPLAIPTATTPLKRQSIALSGPSKKAEKTKESTPSLKEPEVVSQ